MSAVVEVSAKYQRIPLWVVTYDLPAPSDEEKRALKEFKKNPIPPDEPLGEVGALAIRARDKLSARRRFYRKVRKWLQEHEGTHTFWMAMSTVITQSKDFAEFLIREASEIVGATASLYSANMLKFCGWPRQFKPPHADQVKFMFEEV